MDDPFEYSILEDQINEYRKQLQTKLQFFFFHKDMTRHDPNKLDLLKFKRKKKRSRDLKLHSDQYY